MRKALITGANKGIGYEVAKQLLQKGYFVYLGCRDIKNGEKAVNKLQEEELGNVKAINLDVTKDESVSQALDKISSKTEVLDILINNAGISGGLPQTALGATAEQFKKVFDTNVIGVTRVTQAFIDLLKNSDAPRIVNVSSGQGSLEIATDVTSPYYHHKGAVYQPSKSALNMYTVILAYELKDTNFKINAVCPGFTKTDFNNLRGTGTVFDAGKRIIKYALLDDNGPTGQYFCEELYPEDNCPW